MRRISAAIQFTGAPKPLNLPCPITKSPSATIVPGSYFNVGGSPRQAHCGGCTSGSDPIECIPARFWRCSIYGSLAGKAIAPPEIRNELVGGRRLGSLWQPDETGTATVL